jgi:hypothetical protein
LLFERKAERGRAAIVDGSRDVQSQQDRLEIQQIE